VVIAISLAFSQSVRTALSEFTNVVSLPFLVAADYLGLVSLWKAHTVHPLLKLRRSGDVWRHRTAARRTARLEKAEKVGPGPAAENPRFNSLAMPFMSTANVNGRGQSGLSGIVSGTTRISRRGRAEETSFANSV
jgi:hypothetical protein